MSVPPNPPELEAHRAELLRVACWLVPPRLRSRLDPEDLVQKTFEDVLRHPERLSGMSITELVRYLLSALRNNARDEIRRRDPNAEVPPAEFVDSSIRLADLVADNHSSPSQQVAKAEQLSRLAEAVRGLPDAQRVAVEMRFLRGLRTAEIARLLRRSEGAVSQLLNRAMKALRNVLGDLNA